MIKKILKVLGITIGTTGITAAIATAIAINLPMANLEKNGNSTLAFSGCQRILIKEERKVGSDLWRPISTSGHDDIYCVEPGSPVRISEYTPEDIQQYEGRRTGKSCPACAGSPPGYGLYSKHPHLEQFILVTPLRLNIFLIATLSFKSCSSICL